MEPSAKMPWRLVLLASLGGALELYDFILYGVWARAIAGAFFPASDPAAGLVLAFGVFAIGYLARPLGGLILARWGDRRGRRRVFVGSMLAMSITTALISVLPGYASIGLAAPLGLVTLRLLQGLCLGGELAGAIVYVFETVPTRAGFGCGAMCSTLNGGVLLATGASLVLPLLVSDALGWRLGFLFGAVLGLIGMAWRRRLKETAPFLAQTAPEKAPLRALWRHDRRGVLAGGLACAVVAGFNGLVFVHLPSWLIGLGHTRQDAILAQVLTLLAESSLIVVGGRLSDRFGPRAVLVAASLGLLLGAVPAYAALAGGLSWPALLGLAAFGALGAGSFAPLVAAQFPTGTRYSGVALSYNVAFTTLSGLAPLAATALIGATGWSAAPGLYLAACAVLSLIGAALARSPRPEPAMPPESAPASAGSRG